MTYSYCSFWVFEFTELVLLGTIQEAKLLAIFDEPTKDAMTFTKTEGLFREEDDFFFLFFL